MSRPPAASDDPRRDARGHRHHPGHADEQHALTGALALTLGFALVEAVAGWWSGSLALLSDAGHMLTDSTAYGLVRMEILAALANGLLMLVLVGFIAAEAVQRIGQPRTVAGGTVALVAALGLLVNLVVAWKLSRGAPGLNTRAALLHVLGDILGSLAALAAGLVISLTGWTPIDPLLSLLVAALILVSAWRLLAEALHVLLEGVPAHLSLEAVAADLAAVPRVTAVRDLHVWTLASGKVALSAHLGMASLEHWPTILADARQVLAARHGIAHATLQPEAGDNPLHRTVCPLLEKP